MKVTETNNNANKQFASCILHVTKFTYSSVIILHMADHNSKQYIK